MSEEPKDPSGTPTPDPVDPMKEQQVSYDSHRKLLGEKKKLQEERDALIVAKDASALKQLEDDGELQKQLDFHKAKHTESLEAQEALSVKLAGQESKWNDARKIAAFKDALPGSLGSQYLGLIPTEGILLDPDTGLPDPASVQKAVDDFQKEFPEVVRPLTSHKSPNEFANGSSAANGMLTAEEYNKLPYEEKMKRKGDVLQHLKQSQ